MIARSISYSGTFDSAHRLLNYDGKCAHLHGHTYGVNVEATASMDSDEMFILDFTVIKQVINKFDHAVLVWVKDAELHKAVDTLSNSVLVHTDKETTAENLAEAIAQEIMLLIGARLLKLKVEVQETPKGKAQFIYDKPTS